MSNTIQFPNLEKVRERSAQWLAAMDRGLSEAEQQQLKQWLAESPVHAETLVHCASVWDLMDVLAPIGELLPLPDTHKAPKQQNLWGRSFWTAASALACALVVGVLVLMPNKTPQPLQPEPLFTAIYQTEVGEQSEVMLPDQSRLKLNTDTRLEVTFSDASRKVELISGEAYFDVAKNPQRPFVAIAGGSAVTAVGTAFNIELRDANSVEVLVTEGKVSVVGSSLKEDVVAKPAVYLNGGEKIQLNGADYGPVSAIDVPDVEASLAWQQGMIVFQGETLEQVLAEISRYTASNFEIVDSRIADIEVGGYFKAGDTEQLLFVLAENFGIDGKLEGNTWLLSGKPTP